MNISNLNVRITIPAITQTSGRITTPAMQRSAAKLEQSRLLSERRSRMLRCVSPSDTARKYLPLSQRNTELYSETRSTI